MTSDCIIRLHISWQLLEDKRSVLRRQSIEIQIETDKKVGVLPIRIVKSDVSSVQTLSVRKKQKINKKIE